MKSQSVLVILDQIRQLSDSAQRELFGELHSLIKRNGPRLTHRLSELRGLGKEIWAGTDAQ